MQTEFHSIDDLLAVMVERNASDLHLTAGSPPVIRVKGRLERLSDSETLTPEEIRTLMYRILSTEQQKTLETRRQIDFSHSIPGLARFRVNAYFQRAAVGAAFRLIPDKIKTLDELGLPTRLYELADKRIVFDALLDRSGCPDEDRDRIRELLADRVEDGKLRLERAIFKGRVRPREPDRTRMASQRNLDA